MQEQEARPPFVKFESRTEEDRDASIEQGHFVARDVTFAIITPIGSKDTIERKVEDWLVYLEENVRQDRIPQAWLSAYKRMYEDFKESRETPENGTAIKHWPGASPAQIRNMLDINIRTVEDLAEANEEALNRIGMGGRALKQKAITWLKTADGKGKSVEQITKLETENSELKATVEDLQSRLEKLEASQKVDA